MEGRRDVEEMVEALEIALARGSWDAIKNLQNKKYRETLSKSIIQYFKVKGFRKSYNYCKREKEEIGIVNELNFLLLPLVKMRFNCDKTKN